MSEDRLAEPGDDTPLPEETTQEVKPEPAKAEVVERDPEPVPTVPLAALNEERHKNRELKQKLSEWETKSKELDAVRSQLDEWRKSQQAAKEQQAQSQFKNDPLGSIQNELQSLKKTQEDARSQQEQREREQQDLRNLESAISSQVSEFKAKNSDYTDALNHLLSARAHELEMMGVPQMQIEMVLQQESTGIARAALERGMNAAELVYNLAKGRGYTKKAGTDDKVVQIDKGQQKSSTLAGGGKSTDADVNLSDIESMSDEEFDKYWDEKVSGKKRRS